ncbi:hypothetical protein DRQ18_07235 [bacterium]|nr:MAG: hypothetical protein DRQ18_07235 [bacterium]
MKEPGRVLEVDGDRVKVKLFPSYECKKCPARKLCHPDGGEIIIEARSKIPVSPGDEVWVEIKEREVLSVSFLVFGVLLIALLLGFFAVYAITRNPLISCLAALGFAAIYILILRKIQERWKEKVFFEVGERRIPYTRETLTS